MLRHSVFPFSNRPSQDMYRFCVNFGCFRGFGPKCPPGSASDHLFPWNTKFHESNRGSVPKRGVSEAPALHQGLQWASSSGVRLCATRSSGRGLSARSSHEPNERSVEQGLGGDRGSAGSQEGAGLTEPTLDEEPTEPPTLAAAAAAGSCSSCWGGGDVTRRPAGARCRM